MYVVVVFGGWGEVLRGLMTGIATLVLRSDESSERGVKFKREISVYALRMIIHLWQWYVHPCGYQLSSLYRWSGRTCNNVTLSCCDKESSKGKGSTGSCIEEGWLDGES